MNVSNRSLGHLISELILFAIVPAPLNPKEIQPTISITVPFRMRFVRLKDLGSTGKAWASCLPFFSVGRMPISVGLWFLSQQRLMKHETMKNLMKHGEFVVCLHSHQLIHGDVFACFF